ncbi:MAG: SAM-dependent methyltransferase [Thalassobius sp.]|nr:SAM-dependent methyltransferase [Thalassovita sp.]
MKLFFKYLLGYLLSKYYNISYSQDGEDVVLNSYYENKEDYKGFYVDVGAHHPFRFSNTQFFYNKGWKGINIDATPNSMHLFKKFRKKDINLEVGIGSKKDQMIFYCFDEPALNSFSEDLSISRENSTNYKIVEKIEVPILRLETILDEYVKDGVDIDFLTIDVEGLDYEVLLSNNWIKYRPKFLLVEALDSEISKISQSEVYSFLIKKNYQLVAKTQRTLIFKLEDRY